MGFVVEKVPFGNEVVLSGAVLVVGIGESFGAGAKEGVMTESVKSAGPDDFADFARLGATGFEDGAV